MYSYAIFAVVVAYFGVTVSFYFFSNFSKPYEKPRSTPSPCILSGIVLLPSFSPKPTGQIMLMGNWTMSC